MGSLSNVYQGAVDQYGKHLVPWIVINGVVALVGTVIPLIGGLALMPALLRESAAAIEADRPPKVDALFDTSMMVDDVVAMSLYVGAQFLGVLMCLVGWPIAWVLFWLTPEIRATQMVSPMDGMRLSASFVMANLGTILIMTVVDFILLSVGLSIAYVGVFIVMPLITLSWTMYMLSVREELRSLAMTKKLQLQATM